MLVVTVKAAAAIHLTPRRDGSKTCRDMSKIDCNSGTVRENG
jgi:hypothetical protein